MNGGIDWIAQNDSPEHIASDLLRGINNKATELPPPSSVEADFTFISQEAIQSLFPAKDIKSGNKANLHIEFSAEKFRIYLQYSDGNNECPPIWSHDPKTGEDHSEFLTERINNLILSTLSPDYKQLVSGHIDLGDYGQLLAIIDILIGQCGESKTEFIYSVQTAKNHVNLQFLRQNSSTIGIAATLDEGQQITCSRENALAEWSDNATFTNSDGSALSLPDQTLAIDELRDLANFLNNKATADRIVRLGKTAL
ncbi:MAG: hypothetical protein LBM73_03345 [Candidatus Nomurabacteria bacterium]|jgi:hypothetical protein|nr:hypothetical protein [Candidatus Nomurabacteria bacterium]